RDLSVRGPELQESGRALLKAGDSRDRAHEVLGPPRWIMKGSSDRTPEDAWDFTPRKLRIVYLDGRIDRMELQERDPEERPIWLKP
ncbi:MAG: hypothetical protein AB1758_25665, partial [Candidatus Eremiobacterota bacterium]